MERHEETEEPLREQLRLARQLLHWREYERRLIGFELHDGLVQELTAAQMYLEALLASGEETPSESRRAQLEVVARQIRKALAEARQFIGDLHPPILEEAGVVKAVERMIADQPAGGPAIELEAKLSVDRLEPHLEAAIFRIVQEAVANVRRHSRSDRARVRLTQSGEWISVEVRDWGVGFNPAEVEEKSYGLQGIGQRARLLGGRVRVESALGKGTRVAVDLPLALPEDVSVMNDRSCE